MKKATVPSLILIIGVFIILQSCKKSIDNPTPTSMNDLQVAPSFNWESSRVVNLSAGMNMLTGQIGSLCKISVYDADPAKGGNLITSGAAGYGSPFETPLRVPSRLQTIYLKAEDGNAFSETDSMTVSDQLAYTFTQSMIKSTEATSSDPDCSGATANNTISGNQTLNLSNGTTYYVTGTFTGTINFSGSGGAVNICGTAHPAAINNMGSTCFITVTQGGTFIYDNNLSMNSGSRLTAYANSHIHLGGLNMNGTSRLINRCHDFVVNSQFSPSGSMENYGSMKINSGLNINSNLSLFVSSDTMTVTGDMNINTSITNNGPMEVFGHLNLNGATFYHNCKLTVHSDFNLSSGNLTMNGAYLKEYGQITVNSSSALLLKNNSMISTNTWMQNADVPGTGGRSEIKVATSGVINGTNKVTGSIEMVTPTGTLTTGGAANFINGATLTKISTPLNIIQVSQCNPEGIGGTPPPVDTDGDGIANTLDMYPNDATRAFDNYYPSKTVFGTLAFEDLWPGKGDYDMNDLVVDYQEIGRAHV